MDLIFKHIKTDAEKDLKELSLLAHKIWNDHYPSIIGQTQVYYMLDKLYTIESLIDQINLKQNVFIGAYIDNNMAGFISYSREEGEDYFIHKLYVNTDIHRKGIGRALFEHVFKNLKVKTIRLTVNRQNYKAINFYFKFGFIIEKVIDIDIGEGFFMNDFVMLYRSHDQE